MSETPLIECRGLEKTYCDTALPVEVLKDLDLTVMRGDMMAIVGVSGVGKTTILYTLGLLEKPTAGAVLYEGKDIFENKTDAQLSHFRNREIGFVFQSHHLIPEFSVVENVMMPSVICGESKTVAREKAIKALGILGIEGRADHQAGEISGGEQQRAAVARALVMRPKVVLADEPTGNLDKHTAMEMHDEFIRLNAQLNTTFIVVTHNESLAEKMKKIVRLSDGKAQIIK
jgi:lipoprotein-releasing system ATP-binding protein